MSGCGCFVTGAFNKVKSQRQILKIQNGSSLGPKKPVYKDTCKVAVALQVAQSLRKQRKKSKIDHFLSWKNSFHDRNMFGPSETKL